MNSMANTTPRGRIAGYLGVPEQLQQSAPDWAACEQNNRNVLLPVLGVGSPRCGLCPGKDPLPGSRPGPSLCPPGLEGALWSFVHEAPIAFTRASLVTEDPPKGPALPSLWGLGFQPARWGVRRGDQTPGARSPVIWRCCRAVSGSVPAHIAPRSTRGFPLPHIVLEQQSSLFSLTASRWVARAGSPWCGFMFSWSY